MKELVSLLAGVCFAALCSAPAALAQADSLKVHLSEAITAAGTVIPAGDYQVRDLDTSSDMPMLLFHSGSFNAIVAASRTPIPGDDADKTALLLRRDGDRLVLQRVVLEGRGYAYDLHVPVHASNR